MLDKNKINKFCLYSMEIRQSILHIQESLSSMLEAFLFNVIDKDLVRNVKASIDDYLLTLKDRKAFKDATSEVKIVRHGWKELYPNFFVRQWAKIASFLSFKLKLFEIESYKPKIWHHLFPFDLNPYIEDYEFEMKMDWFLRNHQEYVNEPIESYFEQIEGFCEENPISPEWNLEWIEKNPLKPIYKANLRIPYNSLDTNIYICPFKAIDKITLNFKINKNGEAIKFEGWTIPKTEEK